MNCYEQTFFLLAELTSVRRVNIGSEGSLTMVVSNYHIQTTFTAKGEHTIAIIHCYSKD